jgi:hypothetical protein
MKDETTKSYSDKSALGRCNHLKRMKFLQLIWRLYSRICLQWLEKPTKSFIQDNVLRRSVRNETTKRQSPMRPIGITFRVLQLSIRPFIVTARSKSWTAFAHSNTGIVGSNPTSDTGVCARLFCVRAVLCAGSGLETDWSPVQGVLPTVYKD